MPVFELNSLARWTGGRWIAPANGDIRGFSVDSRTLRPGEMFVALKTPKRDGRDFLRAAAAAGAGAALVSLPDRRLGLPQLAVDDTLAAFQRIAGGHRANFPGPVVGVTGSAGKTSTKDLLGLLLGNAQGEGGAALTTEANLNNHIGVPLTLVRLDPAIHRFGVIEAGISARGEMAPLAAMIKPDVAIITLVAEAHLADLGGLEDVAEEKAGLAAAVRKGGMAIFPESCAKHAAFRNLTVKTLVLCEEGSRGPSLLGTGRIVLSVVHRGDRTELALEDGVVPASAFSLCRVTDGMARNAALAICAALRLGVDAGRVRERLGRWRPAKWRGEALRRPGQFLYLDFYNANPASMADALAAFDAQAGGARRIYVIGCMEELGSESARYHRDLGRSLRLRSQDCLLVLGDQAGAVKAGAMENGNPEANIVVADAIDAAFVARLAQGGPFSLFVKGSRRHGLERALEAIAPQEVAHA